MSLKQSCFKSIVVCDLKRSWWISALAALFIFMTSTSPLFTRNYSYSYFRYDGSLDFSENMFGNYVIGMCLAAFVVLYLFAYLNKVNSVSFFHSLPAKRNTLMLAHLTSCSILVVSPMLVNTFVSLFAVGNHVKASWIFVSFGMYLVYSFVILAITVFVSMLTGVSIASGIFTGVLILLPVFVSTFLSELCSAYLYGFNGYDTFTDFLLEYIYLAPEALMGWKCIIYIIAVFAFLGFSLFIYNKRNLENYGEVIAFPTLKGLFEVLFGICSGVIGYYYFEAFWNIESILTMLVFGTLGTVIAHMIAGRSLSIKGALKPLLITDFVVVLLFIAFFFDLFGYETRIPDENDIEYATITGVYYPDYSYVDSDINGYGRIKVYRKDQYKPNYTNKEDIDNFIKLHQYAVEHRRENERCDDDFFVSEYVITERDNVAIEYKLKNGTSLKRSYSLPAVELYELTYDIYNSEVYKKWKYPVIDGTEKTYKSVAVYDIRSYVDGDAKLLSATDEDAKRIIEALKKDKISTPYETMRIKNAGTLITITLNYTMPYVSDDGREYEIEHSDSYNIDKLDVNTWALLEELNLFDDKKMITVDDVTSVGVSLVSTHTANPNSFGSDSIIFDQDVLLREEDVKSSYYYETKQFTDRQDIHTLYDLFVNHQNVVIGSSDDYLELIVRLHVNEKNDRARSIFIKNSDLPEILSYLVQ